MTDHDDPNSAFAVSSALLAIEAFIDGEQVDPETLSDALEDADARAHLIDLLVLRGAVAEIAPAMSNAPTLVGGTSRRLPWMAAAAAVVVSMVVGYVLGQRTLVPAVEASAVETFVQVDVAAPPPTPTHVIRLRPGVDWTDHPERH